MTMRPLFQKKQNFRGPFPDKDQRLFRFWRRHNLPPAKTFSWRDSRLPCTKPTFDLPLNSLFVLGAFTDCQSSRAERNQVHICTRFWCLRSLLSANTDAEARGIREWLMPRMTRKPGVSLSRDFVRVMQPPPCSPARNL